MPAVSCARRLSPFSGGYAGIFLPGSRVCGRSTFDADQSCCPALYVLRGKEDENEYTRNFVCRFPDLVVDQVAFLFP